MGKVPLLTTALAPHDLLCPRSPPHKLCSHQLQVSLLKHTAHARAWPFAGAAPLAWSSGRTRGMSNSLPHLSQASTPVPVITKAHCPARTHTAPPTPIPLPCFAFFFWSENTCHFQTLCIVYLGTMLTFTVYQLARLLAHALRDGRGLCCLRYPECLGWGLARSKHSTNLC